MKIGRVCPCFEAAKRAGLSASRKSCRNQQIDRLGFTVLSPDHPRQNIFHFVEAIVFLESHKVLNSDFTGHEGPVAVEAGNNMANPLYQAFIDAGVEAGYTKTQDYNGYRQEGFGQKFMNVDAGVRASSSYAYLRPIKHRANLKILCKSIVTRIIFKQKKAVGVEILSRHKKYIISINKEVIL